MRSLLSIILVHIIVLGCSLKSGAQGPGLRNEKQAEAASVMQALAANMRGLECFDMSMTDEKSHVASEDDSALESRFRWRYICNFREGVHLIVASYREHRFSLTSDEETRQQRFLGIFVNANERESWLLRSSGDTSRFDLRDKDIESFDRWALKMSAFPDPRLVGSAIYPFGFVGEISIEEVFRRSFSPPFEMTLSEIFEKNQAEIVRTVDNTNQTASRWRYLMDMERFVPLRLAFEIVPKDGEVVRKVTEQLTWVEREGMMVPQELHGERSFRLKRDSKEPTLEHYDVVFSWHSVNEPDELPEVDKTILTNTEAILRLLNEGTEVPDTAGR